MQTFCYKNYALNVKTLSYMNTEKIDICKPLNDTKDAHSSQRDRCSAAFEQIWAVQASDYQHTGSY